MNRLFSKRSKSVPQKNVHFGDSAVNPPAYSLDPPAYSTEPPKNVPTPVSRGRSPIKKWCRSWWEDIVQRAVLDEIGKRSDRLIKEQEIGNNIMNFYK